MNKIISISLWGASPRYSVGAIKNVQIAQELLPDWKCRIFVDGSVPQKYVNQLHDFENVEVAEVDDEGVWPYFWRFYSMFESEDNITLSRDSDSRITPREVRAINEWLTSDKKFSIIRDHDRHYDWPILSGLWGMKGTLDQQQLDVMIEYSKQHFYASCQVWLAQEIWPKAQEDVLIHGFNEVEWMQENRDELKYDFIGQGYDQDDNPIYDYKPEGTIINHG